MKVRMPKNPSREVLSNSLRCCPRCLRVAAVKGAILRSTKHLFAYTIDAEKIHFLNELCFIVTVLKAGLSSVGILHYQSLRSDLATR
jgi:ribosomal protein S27AE